MLLIISIKNQKSNYITCILYIFTEHHIKMGHKSLRGQSRVTHKVVIFHFVTLLSDIITTTSFMFCYHENLLKYIICTESNSIKNLHPRLPQFVYIFIIFMMLFSFEFMLIVILVFRPHKKYYNENDVKMMNIEPLFEL